MEKNKQKYVTYSAIRVKVKVKIKISLLQAMEAHKVARG
jgi:hypothetical protein